MLLLDTLRCEQNPKIIDKAGRKDHNAIGRDEYATLSERPTVDGGRPDARERAPNEPIQEPPRLGRAVEGLDLSFFLSFPPMR